MKTGLRFFVDWLDDDLVGLSVKASNGRFSGVADVIATHCFARELADTLAGFPAHTGDHRTMELGTFDADFAGGGVRLDFHTIDLAGHPAVDVLVRADPHSGPAESARLVIALEAARIDDFVAALYRMVVEKGANAGLVTVEPEP